MTIECSSITEEDVSAALDERPSSSSAHMVLNHIETCLACQTKYEGLLYVHEFLVDAAEDKLLSSVFVQQSAKVSSCVVSDEINALNKSEYPKSEQLLPSYLWGEAIFLKYFRQIQSWLFLLLQSLGRGFNLQIKVGFASFILIVALIMFTFLKKHTSDALPLSMNIQLKSISNNISHTLYNNITYLGNINSHTNSIVIDTSAIISLSIQARSKVFLYIFISDSNNSLMIFPNINNLAKTNPLCADSIYSITIDNAIWNSSHFSNDMTMSIFVSKLNYNTLNLTLLKKENIIFLQNYLFKSGKSINEIIPISIISRGN